MRAARGKSSKTAVKEFRRNLDGNLTKIRKWILESEGDWGKYHFFTIYDPKKRVICAAPFPMRVLFHALMRICHPIFDNYQISGSYASRKEMGQYKAIDRVRQFARQYGWYAKLDVRKYFDSIDHEVMYGLLRKLIKDKRLLAIFRSLIDGYHVEQGKGLPIGNLTSQYFANHYLAVSDHYAKEKLKIKGFVRYMDDMILFAPTKKHVRQAVQELTDFIRSHLKLELHDPVVNRTAFGIPFLGYVITNRQTRLTQRSRHRFKQKTGMLRKELEEARISEEKYLMRRQCLCAFIRKGDSEAFERKINRNKGLYPDGLQPREPGRKLEQQRQELPCS